MTSVAPPALESLAAGIVQVLQGYAYPSPQEGLINRELPTSTSCLGFSSRDLLWASIWSPRSP